MTNEKHPYPSIPPQDESSDSGTRSPVSPSSVPSLASGPPPPQTIHNQMAQATENQGSSQSQQGYSEPPPSYQAAMNCPTQPNPHAYAQPASNPSYPKQINQQIPPGYSPYPPPPPGAAPIHTNVVLDYPRQSVTAVSHRPVVVQVVQAGPGLLQCAHCANGFVNRETDMCCLLCLILLAIFTFPFGLIFLCCIPCTVHRRCNNCHRIG